MPEKPMQEYLMTIANSNFEGWRDNNPDADINEFKFSFNKIGSSPLFDYNKLVNISKNYLSKLTAEEVFEGLDKWSLEYDIDFNKLINKYKDYTINVLNIERTGNKPRKDFSCYSEIKSYIFYMYDELFNEISYEWGTINDKDEIKTILSDYIDNYYNENDDKETWFNKIKELTEKHGYCPNMKEYKENPDNYKGSVADISTVIRVALTSKSATPDLYEIMKLLGKERLLKRKNLTISQ